MPATFKIINRLVINESSYEINNLNIEMEILIFSELTQELQNLPTSLKEILIKIGTSYNYKLPFNCKMLSF